MELSSVPEPVQQEKDDDEIVTVAMDPLAWIRITVLISFAFTIFLTIIYLLSGGGHDIFQRTVLLRTYVADGTGLEKKALVEVDGIKVGRIRSVELSHSNEPNRVVLVRLAVEQKYLAAIPVDSQTEVTADNLLGDKYINIHKGSAHEFAKADDELLTKPADNNFNPADLIASLRTILTNVNTILDQIDNPDTDLGQLVKGDQIYNQIRDDIAGLQRSLHAYSNPRSPIGQAVFGRDLYNQIRQPFVDIDKQLASIQNGEGALGKAYATSAQYDQVHDGIVQFHNSVTQYKNNQLLTDDEVYRSLVATMRDLNRTITGVAGGPLFTDAQLYESLNGASRSAEQFLSEFRKNPQKFLRIKIF